MYSVLYQKRILGFQLQVCISPKLLQVPEEILESGNKHKEEGVGSANTIGVLDLFKNSTVRRNTLILFVNWIVVTLG